MSQADNALLKRYQGTCLQAHRFFSLLAGCCLLLGMTCGALAADKKTVNVIGVELLDFKEYPQFGVTREQGIALALNALRDSQYQLTLEQLHLVADKLTLYLREAGFQFSYAFLPEQNLSFGVLKVQFVEGTLTDIQVLDTDSQSAKSTLKRAFRDLLNQPLYAPDVEERVKRLKAEYPIDFFAYYSRGKSPGQARLNLRVSRFDRWQTTLRADNYGSPATGEQRFIAQTSVFNPLNRLDRLSLGALLTQGDTGDESNTYGYLSYETPLWNRCHQLQLSLGNNVFEVGGDFGALQLEGDATVARLGYAQTIELSSRAQWEWRLAAIRKDTEFTSGLRDPLLEQDEKIEALELGASWHYPSAKGLRFWGVDLALTGGDYDIEAVNPVSDSFVKVDLLLRHERVFFQGGKSALLMGLKLRSQYTEDMLPNSEQASFSGAYGVRSIEAGFFAADRLGLASLEWRLPNVFSQEKSTGCCRWVPLLVLDAGYGEKLLADTAFDRVDAWGVGAGLEFSGWQQVSARLLALQGDEAETEKGVTATSMDLLMEITVTF